MHIEAYRINQFSVNVPLDGYLPVAITNSASVNNFPT